MSTTNGKHLNCRSPFSRSCDDFACSRRRKDSEPAWTRDWRNVGSDRSNALPPTFILLTRPLLKEFLITLKIA